MLPAHSFLNGCRARFLLFSDLPECLRSLWIRLGQFFSLTLEARLTYAETWLLSVRAQAFLVKGCSFPKSEQVPFLGTGSKSALHRCCHWGVWLSCPARRQGGKPCNLFSSGQEISGHLCQRKIKLLVIDLTQYSDLIVIVNIPIYKCIQRDQHTVQPVIILELLVPKMNRADESCCYQLHHIENLLDHFLLNIIRLEVWSPPNPEYNF